MEGRLKVIIVDDEILATQYLKNLISWQDYGFEIAGEFTSARKAVEYMEGNRPHILIADIRMPGMDGLTMSETVLAKYKGTKIILLTSYKDFDYAKKAVEMGISNYILKHELNAGSLLLQLQKLREEICREESIGSIVREKALWDLLEGRTGGYKDLYRFNEGTGRKDTHFFLFLMIRDNPLEVIKTRYNLSLRKTPDFVPQLIELADDIDFFIPAAVEKNVWAGLLSVERTCSYKNTADTMRSIALLIQKSFREASDSTLSIIISDSFKDIRMVHSIYQELRRIQETYVYFGREKILLFNEIRQQVLSDKQNGKADIHPLLESLENLDVAGVSVCMSILFRPFLSDCVPAERYKALCLTLTGVLEVFRSEHRLTSMDELLSGSESCLDEVFYVGDICKWFTRQYVQAIGEVRQAADAGYSKKVLEVLAFINENYTREITIDEIAEKTGISGHYLRHIFKDETGLTVLDYITKMRVEKSKKLLKSGKYKVYEIAGMIGYSSSQYFSQVFKKMTGLTPQEYMERGSLA